LVDTAAGDGPDPGADFPTMPRSSAAFAAPPHLALFVAGGVVLQLSWLAGVGYLIYALVT
jgi:hypothetical protein